MNTAQLRLPFVFPFHAQISGVPSRVRSLRLRAANTALAPIEHSAQSATPEEAVRAGAIAIIQSRQSLAVPTASTMLEELAQLLAGATDCLSESPMQMGASLIQHARGLACRVMPSI